jgi:hypothetical protein
MELSDPFTWMARTTMSSCPTVPGYIQYGWALAPRVTRLKFWPAFFALAAFSSDSRIHNTVFVRKLM